MKAKQIQPVFVQYIPEHLETGKLYISKEFRTALHKCCCGCGEEVVTPLSPADWKLKEGRGTVSLSPSIGNWSLPCKSHYFIHQNQVVWAEQFSASKIKRVKERDRKDKQRYINQKNSSAQDRTSPSVEPNHGIDFLAMLQTFWKWLRSWF